MKDFFDEDFPLSKKQEEERKLRETPKTLEVPPVTDGEQLFAPVETEEKPETFGFDIFSEKKQDPKEYLEQLLNITSTQEEPKEVQEANTYEEPKEAVGETHEEIFEEVDLGFDMDTEAEDIPEEDDVLMLEPNDDAQTVQFGTNGFSYEYDERFFAEEETPAYKYPELHKKAPAPKKSKKNGISVNSDAKKLLTVGAAVATAVIASKLLGSGKKKK